MIRFYIMVADTVEPVEFRRPPGVKALGEHFDRAAFVALDLIQWAIDADDALQDRPTPAPVKPAEVLFPDAGPTRPDFYTPPPDHDPDAWRHNFP